MAQNPDFELLSSSEDALQSLALTPGRIIHAVCSETSEIYKIEVGTESGAPRAKMQVVAKTDGHPSALAFDADGAFFIGDFAHKAILSQAPDVDGFSELVTEYEGRALKGPNSCTFSSDGTLFFTDSGPIGDSSLQHRMGSVFAISAETRMLKPLALSSLAHPSGIAVSPDGNVIFVAEMLANRILRFIRRPGGGFLSSVFKQFSGYVGPSTLFCDHLGRLVVGRFEYAIGGVAGGGNTQQQQQQQQQACVAPTGCITVLDAVGNVMGEVLTPVSQITSVLVCPDAETGADQCYFTDSSCGSLYRIAMSKIIH